jgi:hypothetical protein
MISLQQFASQDFLGAIKGLFEQLKVPVNYSIDKPIRMSDVLHATMKKTVALHELL